MMDHLLLNFFSLGSRRRISFTVEGDDLLKVPKLNKADLGKC
jgi:hypothetical protein